MKSRSKTKQDEWWLEVITDLGCICSIREGLVDPYSGMPVERHHILGKTKPLSHLITIPLRPDLHNYYHIGSVHHNKASFERAYGTQRELWHHTLAMVLPEKEKALELVSGFNGEKYLQGWFDLEIYQSFLD